MGGISGKLKRALWPLVEARARELDARHKKKRSKVVGACSILFAMMFLLSSAGVAGAGPGVDEFQYITEVELHRETPPAPAPEPEPGPPASSPPTSSSPPPSHAPPSYSPPVSHQNPQYAPQPESGPEPEPDFTVEISPDSRQIITRIKVQDGLETREVDEWGSGITAVRVNREASFTVTVASVQGFGGDVSLSVDGVPSGASASMPSSITVPRWGSASVTLDVSTTTSTPEGGCTLTITGAHGGATRSDSAELRVREELKTERTNGFSGPVYDGGSGSGGGSSSTTRSYTVNTSRPTISVSTPTGNVTVPNYESDKLRNDAVAAANGQDTKGILGKIVDAGKKVGSWVNRNVVKPVSKAVRKVVTRANIMRAIRTILSRRRPMFFFPRFF